MPVALSNIRDLLLPGLLLMEGDYKRYSEARDQWKEMYEPSIAAPHIWVPKLSIPQAVALGAAAAIIHNPDITRRFWSGWKL
jgi:hypothetical protein